MLVKDGILDRIMVLRLLWKSLGRDVRGGEIGENIDAKYAMSNVCGISIHTEDIKTDGIW